MMYQYWGRGIMPFDFGLLRWMIPFVFLDLVLKAFALWRSARRGEKWWFVVLMVVNSMGILPGIYLLTHQAEKSRG